MARLVLMNLGLHGHINPTLAMVRELVKRGEEVFYFAPEEFRTSIEAVGARFHPYRSVFSQAIPSFVDPSGRTPMPVRLVTDCLQALPQMKDAVGSIHPDALLFDVMCLPGRVLGEFFRVPTVRLSSTFVLSRDISWKPKAAGDPKVLSFAAEGIQKICQDYGVTPFQFQEVFTHSAGLNIVFTSRKFQPREETFDSRFVFVGASVNHPTDDQVDASSDNLLPLVYIALGTLANQRPDFYSYCLHALSRGSPKRAVMAVGKKVDISALGAIPAGIEIVAHAPQIHLLSEASVFVSHAGMNSLMEALYFGVPLVLLPQTEEQVINAERVVELGAGVILSEEGLSAEKVKQALDRVLGESSYRENAMRLRNEIRGSGGPEKAADAVQNFLKMS